MVRLSDLSEIDADSLRGIPCEAFATTPWVAGPPLAERRVALVTTAGLLPKGQKTFALSDASFRAISGATDGADLLMGHTSINFDRTGFQDDVNVVFPIDRLRELAASGDIGSVADIHYSFMGAAIRPHQLEATAREAAGLLKEDQVNAVLLCPV